MCVKKVTYPKFRRGSVKSDLRPKSKRVSLNAVKCGYLFKSICFFSKQKCN